MSTHQADPIATLRANQGSVPWTLTQEAALAELERRAKIEARRTLFDRAFGTHLYAYYEHADGTFGVCIYSHSLRILGESADSPDHWSALEAALNAAGAP